MLRANTQTKLVSSIYHWSAGMTVGVAVIVAVAVRLLGRLDDPPPPINDPAIRNIITLVALFIVALASWLWVCFASGYSKRLRLGFGLLGFLACIGPVVVLVRLHDQGLLTFSGSLMPRFSEAKRTGETKREADGFAVSPSKRVDFKSTTAVDFPQFLGPERNGMIASIQLSRDWSSRPPREVWRREVGAGWSGFVVANGYAVTLEQRGDEEWTTCYDAATGEPMWGHPCTARHETTLGGVGPRSTPTIHDGRVYVLSATGLLQCLSEDGRLVWSDDLMKRYNITQQEDEQQVMFGRSASPLIVDSLVVVPGGGRQGAAKNLVAFNSQTGELAWESANSLADGKTDQIAYASPTLATLAGRRQILIVNESTASGHEPESGKRLWSHAWPGRSNGNASVSQAVAIADNRVLLSKGYGGGAELLQLSDTGGESLHVESLWKVARVLQTKFSNVVVHNGHAYGLSEGILECVALDSGRRRWKNGRYGHGQILGVGDLLLVLSEDGELHLLEMNSTKHTHLSSMQVLNGKSWNNLCLYGRKLLLRNAEEAVCLELP